MRRSLQPCPQHHRERQLQLRQNPPQQHQYLQQPILTTLMVSFKTLHPETHRRLLSKQWEALCSYLSLSHPLSICVLYMLLRGLVCFVVRGMLEPEMFGCSQFSVVLVCVAVHCLEMLWQSLSACWQSFQYCWCWLWIRILHIGVISGDRGYCNCYGHGPWPWQWSWPCP